MPKAKPPPSRRRTKSTRCRMLAIWRKKKSDDPANRSIDRSSAMSPSQEYMNVDHGGPSATPLTHRITEPPSPSTPLSASSRSTSPPTLPPPSATSSSSSPQTPPTLSPSPSRSPSPQTPPTLHVQPSDRVYSRAPASSTPTVSTAYPPDDGSSDINSFDENFALNVEASTEHRKEISGIVEGRRLVDLAYVVEQCFTIAQHSLRCTMGRMEPVQERNQGLYSSICFHCDTCNTDEYLKSERAPNGRKEVNQAFAWGAMAVGIGHSQAEEFFALLDTPVMSDKSFKAHELAVGEVWEETLAEKMASAIEEEKRLAHTRGDVTSDGVPYISVIVDGGWNKRSYGHNFTSNAGVACVIGQHTGKLLYLGAKNKFCYHCSRKQPNTDRVEHNCAMSFTGPSTSMEQAIIVDGLCHIYRKHGLWVKYLIGDGDSSVYARVKERAPRGDRVIKLECANHITRGYTSKLSALTLNTKYPLVLRKLLKDAVPRLKAAVRGAIRNNAATGGTANQLRADLKNGPRHVFGDHSACRDSYCTRGESNEPCHLEELAKFGMLREIDGYVDYIVRFADRLTLNSTTNLAENYMSLVAKMVGGKRVDFAKGDSYTRRSTGAGLSFQDGPAYSLSPLRKAQGHSPGHITKKVLLRREGRNIRRKLRMEAEPRRRHKKHHTNAGPDCDYGPEAAQPDKEAAELQVAKDTILKGLADSVSTEEKASALERATVEQHNITDWHDARRHRLTASMFGRIVRMRDTTSVQNIVHQLKTRPQFIRSEAIRYGRMNEDRAAEMYEKERGIKVERCGLFVPRDYPFLGASPDRLVEDNGLVEVKCLYSMRNKSFLEEVQKKGSKVCVHYVDGQLKLKRNHDYWFQIQGQLVITSRTYCDLVLYTDHDIPPTEGGSMEEIHIVRVEPHADTWEVALPRLVRFYNECLLPELADSRIERGMKVREPSWYHPEPKNKTKKKPKTNPT